MFIILLVALVPLMALDANGTELRKDKKEKIGYQPTNIG